MDSKNEEKVYEKNRFEFSLFVNDNLVCRRNFKINNFSEVSFQSMDFKNTMDDIVSLIDEDLKSKSRLYMWYHYDSNNTDDEFNEPLSEPWESTFKIIVTDNNREVYSQIWDGRFYPRDIRQNVDLINKFMQIGTYQDGNPIMKEYVKVDRSRLDIEHYIKHIIGSNRQNLIDIIIKKICETCSPEHVWYKDGKPVKEGRYSNDSDYVLSESYPINDNDKNSSITYNFSNSQRFHKICSDWSSKLSEKTYNYFHNECADIFNKKS